MRATGVHAAMLERLCLAQAQEAIFDKARADRKNPATLARCGCCTGTRCVGVAWLP